LSCWDTGYGWDARHRDGGCGWRSIRALSRALLIGATLAYVAILDKRILYCIAVERSS